MKQNIKKVLYYSIRGRYPYVCIMKQTEEGWYWWDICEHRTTPYYYGKNKPRLHSGETYVLSDNFGSVLPEIEQLMAEWKMEVLEDHKLEKTAHNYLEDLFYRNKARFIQYFITKEGEVVTLETKYATSLCNGGEWTQVLGIIGERCRRSWFRQSDGDLMLHASIPQVTQEEARNRAVEILDEKIQAYIRTIKEFCGENISTYKKPTEETGLMEMEHETEKNAEKREMKVVAPEETKQGRE